MINFFRRIRQKLLTENKFSKYLQYAIGEIVLVVIGILIALSINNWNQNKKSQDRLDVYLEQIKKDITIDLEQLNAISTKLKETQKASLICRDYFLDKKIHDPKLFFETYWAIAYNFDFEPRLQGINGLRNSGAIENLYNGSLENLIYEYYTLIDEVAVVEVEYNSFVNNFENHLTLSGFTSKFAPPMTEELLEYITYENIITYSGIDGLFGRTALATDVMHEGYEKLMEIGDKILKTIDERN